MPELCAGEPALISPPQAAKTIGTKLDQVYEWLHRPDDPLPSIPVGSSGKHRRIIRAEIGPWLAREAARAKLR